MVGSNPPHNLGWVTARLDNGALIGFVNVAWDGGDHAFLIDTKVRPDHQRRGIAPSSSALQPATRSRQGASGWRSISTTTSLRSTTTHADSPQRQRGFCTFQTLIADPF